MKDTPAVKKLKKKARRHSIEEGIFASIRGSFGDYYISPFAIAINSSSSMVALLTSIIGLLGPIGQISGSRLMEKFSRKKILLKTILMESLMWIPMIAIAILFYKNLLTGMLPLLLLITFAMYTILLNAAHPAWFSWAGDLVSEKHRGKWFSKRNLLTGFVSIIMAIIASIFLDYFKTKGIVMIGFVVLFTLAFMARMTSRRIMKRQYEPKLKLKKGYYFSYWDFIIKAPTNNFGKFTIFRALMGFASAICAPLIAVYLLRHIGFNYVSYMIITLGGTFVSLFFLELWGKFADRYGNYRTIVIASILIPITPLLWILNSSMIYLLFIPSVLSGAAWAGLHLAAGNFIYDNVKQEKRGLVVSYYNMTWGTGVATGAAIGAFLIKFLDTTFLTPIVVIFLISLLARAIVSIWWLPKIKEVRETKKFSAHKAFKHLLFKEARPTIMEEVHEITSIKKYFEKK